MILGIHNLKGNNQTRETMILIYIRQISSMSEYIYVSNYNYMSKTGFNFTFEKFKDNKLDYKITANRIKYNEKTKNYTLYNYTKRTIGKLDDILENAEKKIHKFNFEPDDLTPVVYIAETMSIRRIE